jgi:hypothetical protein
VNDGDIVPPVTVPVVPDTENVTCVGVAVTTVYTFPFKVGVPVLDVSVNVTNEPTGNGGTFVVLPVKLIVAVVVVVVPLVILILYASILPLDVLYDVVGDPSVRTISFALVILAPAIGNTPPGEKSKNLIFEPAPILDVDSRGPSKPASDPTYDGIENSGEAAVPLLFHRTSRLLASTPIVLKS